MRAVVPTIALLSGLLLSGATFHPTGVLPYSGGTGDSVPEVPALPLGIIPGTPDTGIFASQFSFIVSASRSAGARVLHFYRTVNELSDGSIAGIMTTLGHPTSIVVSVWRLSTISSALPSACTGDWKTGLCTQAIVNAFHTFSTTYLTSQDDIWIGLEFEDYVAANPSDAVAVQALIEAIVRDNRSLGANAPHIGVDIGYDTVDEAAIRALYNPLTMGALCLNSYDGPAYSAPATGPNVTSPASGLADLRAALAFAASLTNDYAICETGYPSSALNNGSEADQATFFAGVRQIAKTTKARYIVAYIGMDGTLPSIAGEPCYDVAASFGFAPSTDASEYYFCSHGLIRVDRSAKPGWFALWQD